MFALAVAALLGIFAVYTAFVGDTTPLVGVAQAAEGQHAGKPVKLTGEVLRHSGNAADARRPSHHPSDNGTARTVRVVYHGDVPDAFGDGKHVVVDGRMQDGAFDAKTDSLVTKCPSKYSRTKLGIADGCARPRRARSSPCCSPSTPRSSARSPASAATAAWSASARNALYGLLAPCSWPTRCCSPRSCATTSRSTVVAEHVARAADALPA